MKENTVKQLVGCKIKKYRHYNNLTQFKLGELIDINQRQVAQIELGKSFPSLTTLTKLAELFECNISDFFENDDEIGEKELKTILANLIEKFAQPQSYRGNYNGKQQSRRRSHRVVLYAGIAKYRHKIVISESVMLFVRLFTIERKQRSLQRKESADGRHDIYHNRRKHKRQRDRKEFFKRSYAVYLRRKSVARDQKAVIQDSLHRLEKAALTATSATPEEATVRVEEAKLIQDFVKRASLLEPDGVIVVSRGGQVNDIWLEDGDEIVIPQKSNVVQITGEVVMPKSIAFEEGMTLDDYLAAAGGVSDRGDEKHILVAKQNGEVGLAEHLGVKAGDRILVLPKVDVKSMLLAKDLMTIVYQIAVATKVAVDL